MQVEFMEWFAKKAPQLDTSIVYTHNEEARTFEIKQEGREGLTIYYAPSFPFTLEGTYCEFETPQRVAVFDFKKLLVVDILR